MSETPDGGFASAFDETAVCSAVDYAEEPPEWLHVAVEEAVDVAELDGDVTGPGMDGDRTPSGVRFYYSP